MRGERVEVDEDEGEVRLKLVKPLLQQSCNGIM